MYGRTSMTSILIYVGLILIVVIFFNVLWYILPLLFVGWLGWTLYRIFFPKKIQPTNMKQNQTARHTTKIDGDTIDVEYEIIDEDIS